MTSTDWIAALAKSARAAEPAAHPRAAIINPMGAAMPAVLKAFDISTVRRQAHFIAQCAVESDYFQTLEEYASGAAYEGRRDLGNTHPGDGKLYKGRGPIQVTGRANYADVAIRLAELGQPFDLVRFPQLVAQPAIGLWAAGCWWEQNHANKVADLDATGRRVSRLVNRGNANSGKPANAEDKRMRAFKAALGVLTLQGAPVA